MVEIYILMCVIKNPTEVGVRPTPLWVGPTPIWGVRERKFVFVNVAIIRWDVN